MEFRVIGGEELGSTVLLISELMDIFGIDSSRAVSGPISARIAHIPEAQPCCEPYAISQVCLKKRVSLLLSHCSC